MFLLEDSQQLGHAVALFVFRMCGTGKSCPLSPFHLCGDFPLSLQDFACRLTRYFACSPSCFVVACAYLLRVRDEHPELFWDDRNVHKLLLAAVTVAAKFCEDRACPQAHYARCGGVDVDELNTLEKHFFALIHHSAFVGDLAFTHVQRELACSHHRLASASF